MDAPPLALVVSAAALERVDVAAWLDAEAEEDMEASAADESGGGGGGAGGGGGGGSGALAERQVDDGDSEGARAELASSTALAMPTVAKPPDAAWCELLEDAALLGEQICERISERGTDFRMRIRICRELES